MLAWGQGIKAHIELRVQVVWGYLRQGVIYYEHSLGLFLSFTLASGFPPPKHLRKQSYQEARSCISFFISNQKPPLSVVSSQNIPEQGWVKGAPPKAGGLVPLWSCVAGAGNSESRKDRAGMPFVCSMAPHGTRTVGCGTGGNWRSKEKAMGKPWDWRCVGTGKRHSIA